LLDLIIIFLVMGWLVASGRSAWLVLVYAWNPLVILEIAGSGHLDVVGAALLMVSFLALSNRMGWLAAIAFVAAIELKFVPIVLAPLFWRRIRFREAVVAVGFGLFLALPFTGGTLTAPIGALPAYLAKWRFNGPVYAMAQSAIGTRALVALPVVAGLAAAAWFRWKSSELAPSAWAWPMGVALLLSPTVYPWYLLWVCPFLVVRATVPLLIWTQTSLLTYFVWHVSASGGGWQLPWWVLVTEFGVVAAAGVWLVAKRTPTKALS
jgi:hypothetical protein